MWKLNGNYCSRIETAQFATLIDASGRLKGGSICGGSAFIGFETGESRDSGVEPGFDGFF